MKRETINGKPYTYYNDKFDSISERKIKLTINWERIVLMLIYSGSFVALILKAFNIW